MSTADAGSMLFVPVAVAIGVLGGAILGRLLTPRPSPSTPVATPEDPAHLSMRQLEELLAPYDHVAA